MLLTSRKRIVVILFHLQWLIAFKKGGFLLFNACAEALIVELYVTY